MLAPQKTFTEMFLENSGNIMYTEAVIPNSKYRLEDDPLAIYSFDTSPRKFSGEQEHVLPRLDFVKRGIRSLCPYGVWIF